MIDIKDIQGNVIYSTAINKGAKRKFQLMTEDYVTLPFSLDKPVSFGLGSYADIDGVRYEVVDLQKPTINTNNGGYDYQLRLEAYYRKWKNKIFKFTPEVGGQEASWSLTASLDVHLGIFLRNLTALGYSYGESEFEFSIDATVENKAIGMTYENMSMIDALSAMAEAWGCEWWVTDNIIHFGRCEYGTPVDFIINDNVAEMTRSDSQNNYATRLYVFGSTRNIPANYRPTDESVVVNGVVQRRLMLPEGTPYIDAYEGMTEDEAIEQVVILDEVYPRTDGNISSVSTYEGSAENEDGTTTTETFYRFTDDGFKFSNGYLLEWEELKVKFTGGSLNGMEFGVVFNPNELAEKNEDGSWNTEAQIFNVVANEDYGRKLPDNVLCPKVGDTYILTGWDSTKIADLGLVAKAEEELLQKGLELSAKMKIDPSTYSCKMMSDYMYGLDENGKQDEAYRKTFETGDKVRLINDAYFADGRESRIIGYEYNLDFPFDNPIYIIGETASYSRIGALESKLEALTYAGQTYTGGGSGVYVIGTNDVTKPSDRNVYSALRSDKSFLSKTKDDRSKGKIASDVGFEVGKFVAGASGAIIQVDKTTGQTIAELDKLYVRMKAYFETLEIINVNSVGGKMILSPAGSVTCLGVEELDDAYRCYFLGEQDGEVIENRFEANDQAFSQMFNAKVGVSNKVSNHYYWRLVTSVSEDVVDYNNQKCHYIDLSKTDCDSGSDIPKAGDVINHRGSREDFDRMNFIEFSSVGTNAPYITLFQGVNSYSLTNKEYVSYGYDQSTGKAYMNVYGDMYVGDRDETSYMRYTQEGGLEIKGKLSVGTTLGGKDLQEMIDASSPEGYQEFVDSVTKTLGDLQNQIDGAIDSYFFDYAPATDNYPAMDWTTEAQKEAHIGDTFTNNISGESWRWGLDAEGNYAWIYIEDTATKKALAAASKAQDTADGKRRVFTDTPYPPYDEGDLWAGGEDTFLMKCVKAKATGEYDAEDWDYADNTNKVKVEMATLVQDTKDELNNAIGQATEAANTYTDEAKSAVEQTIAALDEAKANIDAVYSKSEADEKITESEQAAIDAAMKAADAAIALSEITVKAYADGVVDEEEAARIKQAEENLAAAKQYAEEKAQEAFDSAMEELSKFDYLKAALKEDTTIDGGLIQSSLLQLGYTDDASVFNVMSGTNGIYNKDSHGGGVASWWGGGLHDILDYYTWSGQWVAKEGVTIPNNLPSGLIRMDGTGYFAKGAFWWDVNGEIHADPTALLLSFDVEAGDETLSSTIINIRKDIAAFTDMWEIKTDSSGNSYLYAKRPIATNGGITMYADAGDLNIPSIYDGLPIDGSTLYWENGVLKAKGGTEGAITSITSEMVTDALGYTPLKDHQTIYALTIQKNGTSVGTYTPNSAAKTIDIVVPAKLGDLNIKGDTLSGDKAFFYINRTGGSAPSIYFQKEGNSLGSIAFTNPDTPTMWSFTDSRFYNYWTQKNLTKLSQLTDDVVSGNYVPVSTYTAADVLSKLKTVDGSGSGLDADTLDGVNNGELDARNITAFYTENANSAYNDKKNVRYYSSIPATASNIPASSGYQNAILSIGLHEIGSTAQFFFSAVQPLYYRPNYNTEWNQIAYITDNVASATKLQTPRTIWGQSFDGTGNVSGNLTNVSNINSVINLTSDGNVGIGTTSPAYKLDVIGDINSSTNIRATNSVYVNGIRMYKSQDGVIYIDGNLAVKGGITMYATDAIDVPSIIGSLPVAGYTSDDKGVAAFDSTQFSITDGVVKYIGSAGSVDSTFLSNYLSTNNYAKKSDIPTGLASFTDNVGYRRNIVTYTGTDADAAETLTYSEMLGYSNSLSGFRYIETKFYQNQNVSANRMQIAYGYETDKIEFRRYNNNSWSTWKELAFKSDIPTSLKNPTALTFGSKTYDGSSPKTILASDLGALTSHQTIYSFAIKNSGGVAQVSYTPNSGAAELTLTKAMVGLGNVENTALSSWTGSSKITTVGTISSGTWKGTKIANDYLANNAITINGTSTALGGSFNTASITAGTAGTSSATNGYTLSVPYVTVNKYGIVTEYGTHTHTVKSIPNSSLANSSVKISGTSVSLGGEITQAALRTALGLGSNAYTSTAYLPKSGGTMTGTLQIKTGVETYGLEFENGLGAIGSDGESNFALPLAGTSYIRSGSTDLYHRRGSATANYIILDAYNYATTLDGRYYTESEVNSMLSEYLPKSGGTITGALSIKYSNADALKIYRTSSGGAWIDYYVNNQTTNKWRVGSRDVNSFDWQTYDGTYMARMVYNPSTGTRFEIGQDFLNVSNQSRPERATLTLISTTDNPTDFIMGANNYDWSITARGSADDYMLGFYSSRNGQYVVQMYRGGNVLVTGGITMYSDIRKKTKLQDVELSLKQIADAPLIEHYYNSDEKRTTHVGSIAQYWAGLNDWFCKLDSEGYYTMEIQNAALASAISIARELVKYESKTDKKIRLLKQRISELEDKIELLEKKGE